MNKSINIIKNNDEDKITNKNINNTKNNNYKNKSENKSFNDNNKKVNIINNNNYIKKSDNSSNKNIISLKIESSHAKGLKNLEDSGFLNSTLQCLAHIEKLTKYFLNSENYKKITSNKSNNKFSFDYLDFLTNLWINNNNICSSENIKHALNGLNPLFNNNIQINYNYNYSDNFILLFMEMLHKELNIPNYTNNTLSQNNQFFNPCFNQYDYNSTFNSFAINFKSNYNSIISGLFYGMYNSMMQCLNCQIIIHNIQILNILTFPLSEVLLLKNIYNMSLSEFNEVNILDCFAYYQNNVYDTGENQIFCNNCRSMANSLKCKKILISPKVLIINLIKGENIRLKYEEYLYIKDFLFYQASPNYYQLNGIVSLVNNNYIAFCKSFMNGEWYKYNNEEVIGSTFDEARNTGTPIYLFYTYMKVNS